ncbi:MAG: roadblock/LC7 domain-containing protein [Geobacteraceae bacterium]|nr:roadblock/LC7 domain-containing protein [Geobacteraceae bacterium]
MASTTNLLKELVELDGITTAVIVGRDGFVIDGVSNSGKMETDTVGAVISAGTGSSEVMGKELSVGFMTQGMMEYSDGMIMMSSVGNEAILAVVANPKANLGYVRFQIKKRMPAIEKAL